MTIPKEMRDLSELDRFVQPTPDPAPGCPTGATLLLQLLFRQAGDQQQDLKEQRQHLDELRSRVELLERVEYVHPKLDAPSARAKPVQEALSEMIKKLEQLSRAVANEDEVEADAIRLSVRMDIKIIRRNPQLRGPLRFGLGTLFDVLTFTLPNAMSTSSVQHLLRYAQALREEPLAAETIEEMRRDLDRAGLNLRPTMV
jgi:hypothetical protein